MVIEICNQLKSKGYKPAVISRGYKRKSSGLVVVHDGQNTHCKVHDAGDEPFLIAKKIQVIAFLKHQTFLFPQW